jgi:hypothetical protein
LPLERINVLEQLSRILIHDERLGNDIDRTRAGAV